MAAVRNDRQPGVRDGVGHLARDVGWGQGVLIADQRSEIAKGARRLRQTPAYVASSMGDRAELITLMREAEALGEQWYTASATRSIAQLWRADREVLWLSTAKRWDSSLTR